MQDLIFVGGVYRTKEGHRARISGEMTDDYGRPTGWKGVVYYPYPQFPAVFMSRPQIWNLQGKADSDLRSLSEFWTEAGASRLP